MRRAPWIIVAVGLVWAVPGARGQPPERSRIYGEEPRRPAAEPERPREDPHRPADPTEPERPRTPPPGTPPPPRPADPRVAPRPTDPRTSPPPVAPPRVKARTGNPLPWGDPRRPVAPRLVARPGEPEIDPSKAPGLGLLIADVRILGNKRTSRATLLTAARIPMGKPFTLEVRDQILRNLLSSGFVRNVEVNWEIAKDRPGYVILFITVKEKMTWYIAPLFSYSDGQYGGSLAYGDKNLRGLGKQLRIYGAYTSEEQRFNFKYTDPNIRFSLAYWSVDVSYDRMNLKDYDPSSAGIRSGELLRFQTYQMFTSGLTVGYRWYNWVATSVRYQFGLVDLDYPRCLRASPMTPPVYQRCLTTPQAAAVDPSLLGRSWYLGPYAVNRPGEGWIDNTAERGKFWHWRRDAAVVLGLGMPRSHSVYDMLTGFYLAANLTIANRNLGSSEDYLTWQLTYQQGWSFAKRHNVEVRAEHSGSFHAPYYREPRLGGLSLRGYIYNELAGDTLNVARIQYKVHMWRWGWFHFRAVAFWDTGWVFFRDGGKAHAWLDERDGRRRYFLPNTPGPGSRSAWNNGVGAGLRVYVGGISLGTIGLDVAYGIESERVRFYFTIGS